MGAVHHTVPTALASALVQAADIGVAIETGTFHGSGAHALRSLVPSVWSIDLSVQFHARAVAAHSSVAGLHFLQGASDDVLLTLSEQVLEPVLFWLDAHSGTNMYDIGDEVPQCPLLGELAAIRRFPAAASSCILIDDARAFLGPLVGAHIEHRIDQWPTITEVMDELRVDCRRFITILDDVIIAVPLGLRSTVEAWWIRQLEARNGKEAYAYMLELAINPPVGLAAKRLIKSLLPTSVTQAYLRRRAR